MDEKHFTAFLLQLADRVKEETGGKYNPTAFRNMLYDKGGVMTAQKLINDKKPSDGYTKLWELGRLDLTVEAQVLENEECHNLFTEDNLNACKKRLKEYEYFKK